MESTITFDINPTNPKAKLGVEVWLSGTQLLDVAHVSQLIPVTIQVGYDDADHELKIVLKNKTADDTIIDSAGNIVQDSCLTVNNFKFDNIAVDQLMSERAVYRHNFNSNNPVIDDEFYWLMGCNGTVSLQFTTPSYIWLLENM